MKHSRIAIIGVGAVGSTIAYALMLKNIISEIVLIDANTIRCGGEAKDLADALSFSYTSHVYQGSYEDAKQADIVIIAAGKPQLPGQSRLELLEVNKRIFKSILDDLTGIKKDAILLVVANPLDLLTFYAHKNFDLPPAQILGTGTFLDSQRLKRILSCELGVGDESITGWVLGEHGDSEVVAWSNRVHRWRAPRISGDFQTSVKRK